MQEHILMKLILSTHYQVHTLALVA